MTIICHRGCGNFMYGYTWREGMRNLDSSISKMFCPYSPICPAGYSPGAWVWDGEDGEWFAYEWQKTKGFGLRGDYYKRYSSKTHSEFLEMAEALKRDLLFYCLDSIHQKIDLYRSVLPQLREMEPEGYDLDVRFQENGELVFSPWKRTSAFFNPHPASITHFIENRLNDIHRLEHHMPLFRRGYEEQLEKLEHALKAADNVYRNIFVLCLKHHQSEGIVFEAALENFLEGDFDLALEQLRSLIAIAEEHNPNQELLSKLYLLQGEVQSECGLYSGAIIALTTAITKNPSLKEAYFERAAAYFELGEFDKSIEDYLSSEAWIRPTVSPTQLGIGIAAGIVNGVRESALEFIPSTLATLRGLGNGLWALGKNPIGASQDFTEAATQCMEYLKAHSSAEILQDMVPELKELIQNYDHLEDLQKGKLIGHVIGKYGIEILFARQGAVAIRSYRNFKKANQAMTLEALASTETGKAIIRDANAHWAQIEKNLKTNGLKIIEGKHGNHLEGHINYKQRIERKKTPSIFEHPDPEGLARKYAGRGIRRGGDLPGMPGYKELINFEELIGYAVEEGTGKKTPTQWGIIHYAKEGIHIVPTLRSKGIP